MKKYLCLLTAVLLLCGLTVPTNAAEDATIVYVNTYAELLSAVQRDEPTTIVLKSDIQVNTILDIRYHDTEKLENSWDIAKAVVLDLNGFILTVNGKIQADKNTKLVIKDSGNTGCLRTNGIVFSGLLVVESGRIEYIPSFTIENEIVLIYGIHSSLRVEGGEIICDASSMGNNAKISAVHMSYGGYSINGGVIKAVGYGAIAIKADCFELPETSTVRYEEVEILDYITLEMEITGGLIQAEGVGATGVMLGLVQGWSLLAVTMTGGEITANGHLAAGIATPTSGYDKYLISGIISSSNFVISNELDFHDRENSSGVVRYNNSFGRITEIDINTQYLNLYYNDVPFDAWYFAATERLKIDKIMSGFPDGTFRPDELLNRAELVTLISRISFHISEKPAPFTDVPSNSYYTGAVNWAYKNGIVTGTSSTTFSPNDPITREQLVTMLYRYAVYKGQTPAASVDATQFTDYATVSDYAKPAVNWAVSEGLLTGKGNQTLEPQSTATRAETAALIARYIDSLE